MASPNYDENDLSISVNELSVENDDELSNVHTSKLLKFGVDRILSDEIASDRNKTYSSTYDTSNQVYQPTQLSYFNKDDITKLATPTSVTSTPPCSGCITSLFRCCRLHVSDFQLTSPYQGTYYSGRCSLLHTPKPLRPYANLILESEIPDRANGPGTGNLSKRKRSWSRAVFSNLQRKGLEKRFQIQKYITKPDRRQLAATLGLTDAQVKVWFQNRRMKWRHNKEMKYHANNSNANSIGGSLSSVSSTPSSPSLTSSPIVNSLQKTDNSKTVVTTTNCSKNVK